MEAVAEVIKEEQGVAVKEEAQVELQTDDANAEDTKEGVLDAKMALDICGCEGFEMVESLR